MGNTAVTTTTTEQQTQEEPIVIPHCIHDEIIAKPPKNFPNFYKEKGFDEQVPRDEKDNSFVKSFSIDETNAILDFFNTFGFVVIRDVISEKELEDSVCECWEMIEKITDNTMKRDDIASWYKNEFICGRMGIVGGQCCWGHQAMKNRQNETIFKAFQLLYNRSDLWTAFDRFGFMRPTKQVKFSESEVKDMEDWKTRDKWIHFDLNPWDIPSEIIPKTQEQVKKDLQDMVKFPDGFLCTENNNGKMPLKLQGLLALSDAREEDGGFITIPKFSKFIQEWASQTKPFLYSTSDFNHLDREDPCLQYTQKIPIRKGSLLIWNGTQPHANYPNNSCNYRMVQYIKMFPAIRNETYRKARVELLSNFIPKDFQISPLGKKLFGYEAYSE